MKALEQEIKMRMQTNFTSVRKAWLELDDSHKGFITVEELAKYLGGKFEYTLLEILVKMRTKDLQSRIDYRDFCSWFGPIIEPTEGFYFRHDSKKNP